MEIINPSQGLAVHATMSGRSVADETRIVQAVAGMFGNLNVYGKKWAPAIGQGWLMALSLASDITTDEFLAGACWWLSNEKDFPTPADVFSWVRSKREDFEMQETLKRTAEVSLIERRRDVDSWCMAKFGRVDPPVEMVAEYMKDNPFMAIATTPALEADNRKPSRLKKITDNPEQMAQVKAELEGRLQAEPKAGEL